MITPWSTTAVEITQNMNISGIKRIEEYFPTKSSKPEYDKMLQRFYNGLDQIFFTVDKKPDPIVYISNLEEYNVRRGLALNPEEIQYLNGIAKKIEESSPTKKPLVSLKLTASIADTKFSTALSL